MWQDSTHIVAREKMFKSAALTAAAALLVVALLAGAAVISYYQYERYMAACSVFSGEPRRQRMPVEPVGDSDVDGPLRTGVFVELELVKDESGTAVVQSGERVFASVESASGAKIPDYRSVEDFLVRRKNEFKPTAENPALRVLVRQGKGVDFKYVLTVLKVCEKAGLTNIRFESAPDPIAEEIERLEREKDAAKQE